MPVLVRKEELDVRNSNVPYLKTFQKPDRHSDITTHDLSEQWGINLSQYNRTIKKTTQKFLRRAVISLSRRYRTEIVFYKKGTARTVVV